MYCEIKVNTVPVRMLIGLRSARTILPLLLYNKRFSYLPSMENTAALRDFPKAVIIVNEIVETMFQFGDRQVTVKFFVVDGGSDIL